MRFTVFGGDGYIGAHLVRRLRSLGHDVAVPSRDTESFPKPLGHVIYAIGLTGDFRGRPYATIEAHVTKLGAVLQQAEYESWLYLSSTRVYGLGDRRHGVDEETEIAVRPSADSLYDLSKLLGESLCLALPDDRVRVARLSNISGPGQSEATFLGSILKSIDENGRATIDEAPDSAKDYLAVDELVDVLPKIAAEGRHRIYNVAAGRQTTHAELAAALNASLGECVAFAEGGVTRVLAPIDIGRIQDEFPDFRPTPITQVLAATLCMSTWRASLR